MLFRKTIHLKNMKMILRWNWIFCRSSSDIYGIEHYFDSHIGMLCTDCRRCNRKSFLMLKKHEWTIIANLNPSVARSTVLQNLFNDFLIGRHGGNSMFCSMLSIYRQQFHAMTVWKLIGLQCGWRRWIRRKINMGTGASQHLRSFRLLSFECNISFNRKQTSTNGGIYIVHSFIRCSAKEIHWRQSV